MYHREVTVGGYEGSEPKWWRNEIKHKEPYVTIKNIEIIAATTLTSPYATKIKLMLVTIVELKGSFSSPTPLPIKLLILLPGKVLSIPIACNVLGATSIDPIAEDIVDAANPSGIIIEPKTAILLIISWSLNNSSGLAETDDFQIIIM